jgi:hypothetical protein
VPSKKEEEEEEAGAAAVATATTTTITSLRREIFEWYKTVCLAHVICFCLVLKMESMTCAVSVRCFVS